MRADPSGTEPPARAADLQHARGGHPAPDQRAAGYTRDGRFSATVLDAATLELFNAEERMPAARVVGATSAHLDHLTALLATASDDATRHRLTSQAGTTAALSGWLAFDRGDFDAATRYYGAAAQAAADAPDPVLAACVATYRSYLASANGRAQEASRFLVEALDVLPRGSQPAMTAWLSARQAEETAALGDHGAAVRLFDRAYAAQDFISEAERPVWTRFFTPARLDGMAVAVYARANHPDMDIAARRLETAVEPNLTKVGSIALADLSCAYLERGDVEQGATFGQRALDAIRTSDTRVGYERLAVVDRALRPYRNARDATGLHDQLAALLSTKPETRA